MIRFLLFAFLLFTPSIPSFAASSGTAVVVVDMQDWFFEKVPSDLRDALIQEQIELLAWASRQGHSVLVYEYPGCALLKTANRFKHVRIF